MADQPKSLSEAEILKHIAAAQRGSVRARQRVVVEHVTFVRKVVNGMRRRYRLTTALADDLFNEGVIGLDRAIDKFDNAAGVKFITYAAYWIRATTIRHLKGHFEYESKHQQPSLVIDRDGCEGEERETATDEAHEPEGDFLSPLEQACAAECGTAIRRAVSTLTEEEEIAVYYRHLLVPPVGKPMTLQEIGDIMGLTHEAVRQILVRAERKLRERLSQYGG